MLAIPSWGVLQRRFVERAKARVSGNPEPSLALAVPRRRPVPRHLRAWSRFGRTLLRALVHRATRRRPEILLFTLAGTRPEAEAYFGPLADWLGAERTFTVYLAAGGRLVLPSSAQRAPLESYSRAADVVRAWVLGARARLQPFPDDAEHAALAVRLAREEIASGETFLNAFLQVAFERMLATLRPRVLVYPFENRTWERALVAAARAAGIERIVGYQHTSITPRHLAFEIPPDSPVAGTLPDCVITVGGVTAQWLRERAPALAGRVVEGASLRRGTADLPLPREHALLVAISSSREEARALIGAAHAVAALVRMPIVVRSHPTIPAEDLFARLQWPAHVRLSRGRSLDEDLRAATLVLYSSSTVALEGMLHGRLPIFFDIGDVPAADPLIGDCPTRTSVATAEELAAAIETIARLSDAELSARREAARAYAAEYLRAPVGERVGQILTSVLARTDSPAEAPLRLTAVIPTRNRPEDLERAVASVRRQTRLPDEILIVDQSESDASRRRIESLLSSPGPTLDLRYLHDPAISGLVHAKQVASRLALGDLVCFLEDDIVLEPDFFSEIERGFRERPDMLGCCGVVTNLPPLAPGYARMFRLFHRGIFHDPRVDVQGSAARESTGRLPLVESRYLSGGLSCWRREVFRQVAFDLESGFHLLEDADFSTRAAETFGPRFFINPNARADHRMSATNRDAVGPRTRRKLREYVVFYRKRAGQRGARLQFLWLLVGLFLEAGWQSLRTRTLAPLGGFFAGITDGQRRNAPGAGR